MDINEVSDHLIYLNQTDIGTTLLILCDSWIRLVTHEKKWYVLSFYHMEQSVGISCFGQQDVLCCHTKGLICGTEKKSLVDIGSSKILFTSVFDYKQKPRRSVASIAPASASHNRSY